MSIGIIFMAGGSGRRFWPKSTSKRPKQFLSLHEGQASLLVQTIQRFESWKEVYPLVVTTDSLLSAVKDHLVECNLNIPVLAEPIAKNTSACIFFAAKTLEKVDPHMTIVVVPSDHYIASTDAFLKTLQTAIEFEKNHLDLVTLGIQPTRPETGFGYLKVQPTEVLPYRVENFIEKPEMSVAVNLFQRTDIFWNSGVFVFNVKKILHEFSIYLPMFQSTWDKYFPSLQDCYAHFPDLSIDYGILEKSKNIVCFPLQCGWDDIGSFSSFFELANKFGLKKQENFSPNHKIIAMDSANNFIDVPNKVIALFGVHDLIVVETPEVIFITHKNQSQDIRKFVDKMEQNYPDLV